MTEDLEQHVSDLEERVSYLERELDVSWADEKFKRNVGRCFSSNADIEISGNEWGQKATVTNVDVQRLPRTFSRLDDVGLNYTTHENGEGDIVITVSGDGYD